MEKQGYRFTGKSSVVKICHYTKSALKGKQQCYKHTFYGIKSAQCAQMAPTTVCSNRCQFCWRSIDIHSDVKMSGGIDDPETIIENTIAEQIKLLAGFNGSATVDQEKLAQIKDIKSFAISATGEPTLYPRLGELIQKLRERNITSFLVSNGQFPEAIEKLEANDQLPTQLYISLDAPTEEIYKKVDQPLTQNPWERFQKTLDILKRIRNKTRTVLRITAVKGLNMCNEADYVACIRQANPRFVEVKGYAFVGESRLRLTPGHAPTHREVKAFAQTIASHLNWKILTKQEESRAILLAQEETSDRILNL